MAKSIPRLRPEWSKASERFFERDRDLDESEEEEEFDEEDDIRRATVFAGAAEVANPPVLPLSAFSFATNLSSHSTKDSAALKCKHKIKKKQEFG